MRHLKSLHTTISRKQLIVCALLVSIILAIGGYALWSKQIWSEYTPGYTAWRTEIKSTADSLLKLPVTTTKERVAFNAQLKSLSQDISDKQAICSVTPVVQWQSKIIASLEQARKACQATYGDIQAFRSQLSIITVHTDDDQKLADILRQAPQAAELNEDGLVQQISAWNSVIDSLNKMSPSATFKPVHQEAVKKTTGIKAGWEEVVAAHQAKDKAKYTAAVAALGDSYDELDALTTIGESSIATLAADLQNKYQLTFG